MKVAAISPRMISFNQRKPEKPLAATAVRPIQEPHAAACREARPIQEPHAVAYREARPLHLTPREREVLSLLCQGFSNKLISRELGISAGTVKIHVGKVLAQLGVASRLQAVVAAHRQGLLQDAGDCADENGPDREALETSFVARAYQPRSLRAA